MQIDDGRKEISSTWRVGRRWKVTMRFSLPPQKGEVSVIQMEWEPDMPDRRLNKKEIAEYRRGRDAAIAEVQAAIGGNVLLVECGQ